MSVSYRQSLSFGFSTLKKQAAHPGLWFDKYLQEQIPKGTSSDSYQALVDQCCQMIKPNSKKAAAYKQFYDRWLDGLFAMGVEPRIAHVNGRLALGLGNASVIETGTTIHHTYGVPYIPGSSLKGTAAAYANSYLAAPWQREGDAHKTLFGSQDNAGFITFFDALPLPDTDITTLSSISTHLGIFPVKQCL